MSHFTVAVITEDLDKIESMLFKFCEDTSSLPRHLLTFNDEEDDLLEKYNNKSSNSLFDEEGKITSYQQRRKMSEEERSLLTEKEVPFKELYSSFEEFVDKEYGYPTRDETKNRYGYWYNENAKWDWYVVGGRWKDTLLLKDGSRDDVAKIKDILFKLDETIDPEHKHIYDKVRQSVKDEYDKINIEHKENEQLLSLMLGGAKDEETFIKNALSFGTFAVLTPDGVWHEKGEMGWFGCSSETKDEADKWDDSYYNSFIKDANPEHYFCIVDCHI
jgi:hypothetical protein